MTDVAVVLDDVEFGGSAGTSKSYMVISVASRKSSTPAKKSCIVWEENSHNKWYTRTLPVIDTILRFGLGQERIFAHQRTTFSVSLFRTDDNDRLNGVVKEKVLVAGLLGVP